MMKSLFRKLLDSRCGVGGIKCSCCNDYHGKNRKKIIRAVRRSMKQNDMKEF